MVTLNPLKEELWARTFAPGFLLRALNSSGEREALLTPHTRPPVLPRSLPSPSCTTDATSQMVSTQRARLTF